MRTIEGDIDFECLDFSPDGQLLGMGTFGRSLYFLEKDKVVRTLEGFTGSLVSVAFSPDGMYLVTGADHGVILIWGIGK